MTGRSERFTVPEAGGIRLHAAHWGEAGRPLLVLLHGGGANVHWWDHVAPRLARDLHVVGLDFRGHGDSDHPEELVVGAFSDDLEALLRHLGAPAPILVGHSLGARVALDHAARSGDVGGLVLLDMARGSPPARSEATRRALGIRRRYATREEAVRRFRFLPGSAHAAEPLRRAVAEASIRQEPDGRFGFKFDPRWSGVPSRPLPPLDAVACPTLVVRGAESTLLTGDGARSLADAIPGALLEQVPGAGHHVHIDRPEQVCGLLEPFLVRCVEERRRAAS